MKFDVAETTERIIEDIKKYYQENNAQGAIVGLSGGKDSSVVASLLVKALGCENVIGLWLPCHSKEEDKKDALMVAKCLNISLYEHDLTLVYDTFVHDFKAQKLNNISDELLENANINLKPRLRMNTLYYYASYFTSLNKKLFLVCGTSNKSERYVGYFTKGGDNVCDIAPIKHLFVDEVMEVGKYLKMVPDNIIEKTPDDGISGKTDEEKLGISYQDIKKVIEEEEQGVLNSTIKDDIRRKVQHLHNINQHKFNVPTFRR